MNSFKKQKELKQIDFIKFKALNPSEYLKEFFNCDLKSEFLCLCDEIEKKDESIALEQYKQGGAFNVIPEGALHKNKHHLENVDSKFEEVTTKGIPVISESKDGNLIQHAEVEKEEIIFRLEVTKKLEELAKKDTDEAAIEAGKLLVTEILHNTIDKTNNML